MWFLICCCVLPERRGAMLCRCLAQQSYAFALRFDCLTRIRVAIPMQCYALHCRRLARQCHAPAMPDDASLRYALALRSFASALRGNTTDCLACALLDQTLVCFATAWDGWTMPVHCQTLHCRSFAVLCLCSTKHGIAVASQYNTWLYCTLPLLSRGSPLQRRAEHCRSVALDS